MFGEAFDGRSDLVGSYTTHDLPSAEQMAGENGCVDDGFALTGDQLDGMFEFPQYYQAIRDVFQLAQSTDRIRDLWEARPTLFGLEPNQLGTGLAPIQTLVNFIDNHDVPRFRFQGDQPSLQMALTFVMTEQGIPCVYYGTEQGLSGGNDPANREDMWQTGFDPGHPTYRFIQRLTAIRRAVPALRRGDQNVVWATASIADEEDAGIFAFERLGGDAGDSYALVVFNTNRAHDSTTSLAGTPMTVSQPDGTVLVDVLGGLSATVGAQSSLAVTLPPGSAAIFVPDSQAQGI
jgi:glycosidase